VFKNTNVVLLNALDLKFNECYIIENNSNKIESTETKLIVEDERVQFTFGQDLLENNE